MERERLTITLRSDLVDLLDSRIDGYRLRNRSHAIEYYLSRELGGKLSRAVILCGGNGVQLRPFTYELPKALIPVKGRPLLEHTIDMLRDQGIRDIVLTVDYLGDKIEQHFGDGAKFGVKIQYVQLKKPAGTAGSLSAVENVIGTQPFLLLYGDVLASIDYQELIEFHANHKKLVTMAVTSHADPSAAGAVSLRGSKVVSFTEKPKTAGHSRLISAGIFVMEPAIFATLVATKPASLEEMVFPQLVDKGEIVGFVFDAPWYDITTPESYERVLKEWKGQ